jgi:hypothetical protein
MIVRIASGGQYRLPDSLVDQLNELDNAAVQAVEDKDEPRLRQLLEEMAELVRTKGEQVPDDELAISDVIVPPPDLSLEEATSDFTGEGLIPEP